MLEDEEKKLFFHTAIFTLLCIEKFKMIYAEIKFESFDYCFQSYSLSCAFLLKSQAIA